MSNGRSKSWCFTINNWTEADQQRLRDLFPGSCTYIVWGREVAPTTRTPHLQGYVEFSTRKRLTAVKNLLGEQAHCEVRRGTPEQAAAYCKTDGDWEEQGTISHGQGHRRDLEEVKDLLDHGHSMVTIAERHFSTFVRYHRGIEAYAALHPVRRAWEQRLVICLTGPTGCGKTSIAVSIGKQLFGESWIAPDPTLKWFQGYIGQDCAILDDYRGGARYDFMLRLLDQYEMQVPCKGGFHNWRASLVFITSNTKYHEWHPEEHCTNAISRRITLSYAFDDGWVEGSTWQEHRDHIEFWIRESINDFI